MIETMEILVVKHSPIHISTQLGSKNSSYDLVFKQFQPGFCPQNNEQHFASIRNITNTFELKLMSACNTLKIFYSNAYQF